MSDSDRGSDQNKTMQEYAKTFYKSTAWKHCRENYVRSVGGLCEECLRKGLYVPAEIVHHKVHVSPENIGDPEVTLSHDNLEALCRKCHGERHGTVSHRYTVDALGRVVSV